jgi:hypothetical protein
LAGDRARRYYRVMTITAGTAFGSWTVASLDPSGKRATCACVCGSIRVIAVAALASGSAVGSCGCRVPPREHFAELREEAARQRRRRDHNWRPG